MLNSAIHNPSFQKTETYFLFEQYMKLLGLIIFGISLIYGFGYLLPLKIRINNKYGWKKSPDELIKLAKQGDKEAMKIYAGTKVFFVLCLCGTALLYVSSKI